MTIPTMPQDLIEVAARTKYPLDAFIFIQRGLDFTVRMIHGELDDAAFDEDGDVQDRHITGEQLCLGLRRFAMQQYGLLARMVLSRWSIESCEDFGRLVFAMVDAGLMYKTDEDSIEDFRDVFDFQTAFERELSLAKRI